MDVNDLRSILITPARAEALKAMLARVKNRVTRVDGLAGSMTAMLLASLPKPKSPYIAIADSLDQAGYLYHDICQICGEDYALLFPSGYKRAIKYGQPDPPQEILRTQALDRWHSDNPPRVIVTYPEALAEKVASPEAVESSTIRLAKGRQADMTQTVKDLLGFGFKEVDYVYEPGQFAVRGSILDVYSFASELPFRADFFGDEIESLRTFSVETQLSVQSVDQVAIINGTSSGRGQGMSLLEFAQDSSVIFCRDFEWALQRVKAITEESFSQIAMIAGECDTQAADKLVDYLAFDARARALRRVECFPGEAPAKEQASLSMRCSPQGVYHKNFELMASSFADFLAKGYKIYVLSDSDKQTQRLRDIFQDRGDQIEFTPVSRTLHEGFVDNQMKVCAFTDHQIFDRFHKYSLKSDKARSGKLALSIKELNQIETGDYIVHVDYGVGQFGGLLRTDINGRTQEMIKLIYLNGDLLFVPIHSLHKLAKYRGKEGVPPKINKLGSGAWGRMKDRAKSKLKDIARDLIKLYAERKEGKGFAFSPDGYMQHELEASFIYEETPDQAAAAAAVKSDMESPRPMDRLICGDVGFGKTEVAIRAALKAAADAKQTALLVPTTVLAHQHFRTFSERLADFPVRVDYLSRARKPKDVKQITADLAEGKIDIIIGTHKLIGKTVKFKDLGLLIVDEEQKFGVAVKERLRQMKTSVDTLTMTATPIPRTLQFSLMGARDMSAITTPPANRQPILTTVGTINDDTVGEAINFEMSRNGQVFFVSPRIEDLSHLLSMVTRLAPDARVATAHGQMQPEKLERTIIDFANHDYDILLATTIIENGIDMPNVNTIIINNAHKFGLSELHQLRGRVGRSSRKAFCYMLVPPGKPLPTAAHRRLQAIESFSDLGSGINVAMQDLDIRGAGNLLGAEQSGFIADLGYETYQKILKEAVLELRAEEFADSFNTQNQNDQPTEYVADCLVETDMELLLPASYVPQEGERISLYQKLDAMERADDVEQFCRDLQDRFGKIPRETQELVRIVTLRRTAKTLGIEKIALKQGRMYIYFVGEDNKAYYQSQAFGRILNYLQSQPARCQLRDKLGRRSIVISEVTSVEEAVKILTTITRMAAI